MATILKITHLIVLETNVIRIGREVKKKINSTVLVVTGTGIEDQSSDGDTSK